MTFTLFAPPASLQYVDSADSVRYVQTLVEHRDHLANDPEYLAFVHNGETFVLEERQQDGFQVSQILSILAINYNDHCFRYKQRILCFLLSHVVCLPSKQAKVDLLRSLKEVHNRVKLQMLAPLLKECLKTGEDLLQEETCDVVLLSLTSYDTTCVKDLGADQSPSWALLLDCVKSFHLLGAVSIRRLICSSPYLRRLGQCTPLWTSLLSHLGAIYNALPSHRQHELCTTLITIGSSSDDSVRFFLVLTRLVIHPIFWNRCGESSCSCVNASSTHQRL